RRRGPLPRRVQANHLPSAPSRWDAVPTSTRMNGMNPIHWDALLALANVQRGRLSQIAERVHPYTLPHVAATPEQLDDAEARIGEPLDPLYRELLGYGNGWPLLIWDADMLGTDDLGQGPRWAHGHALLDLYYANGDTSELPDRDRVYPILVSPHDNDVMVLRTDGPISRGGHEVIWLGDDVVDRWENAFEWWLAVIELLKRGVAYYESNPLPPR